MIKEMKPHVAAYVQQLVGGNSNLESKLQALLPGVFADTGAVGKTDRRLNDLAVAIDERQGRSVLLIETLGRDGLRYWSYSGGELQPDDIFTNYTYINSEDGLTAWGILQRYFSVIEATHLDDLEDWWGGLADEGLPPHDINVFDSCLFVDPEGRPGLHCNIYLGKELDSSHPVFYRFNYDEPSLYCSLPDWLYQRLVEKRALESGAAD